MMILTIGHSALILRKVFGFIMRILKLEILAPPVKKILLDLTIFNIQMNGFLILKLILEEHTLFMVIIIIIITQNHL